MTEKFPRTKSKKIFKNFKKLQKVKKWPFFAVFLPVFSSFFLNAPAYITQSPYKKMGIQRFESSIYIYSYSLIGSYAAENYNFFIFEIFVIFRKFSKNAKKADFGHFCTFLQKIQNFIFLSI